MALLVLVEKYVESPVQWNFLQRWKCYAIIIVAVQSLRHVQLFANSWTIVHQAPLSSTVSQGLLKFMSIESVMLSNHLILYHSPLLLPSIFISIRVFSNELTASCAQILELQFQHQSPQWRFSVDFLRDMWISSLVKWLLKCFCPFLSLTCGFFFFHYYLWNNSIYSEIRFFDE